MRLAAAFSLLLCVQLFAQDQLPLTVSPDRITLLPKQSVSIAVTGGNGKPIAAKAGAFATLKVDTTPLTVTAGDKTGEEDLAIAQVDGGSATLHVRVIDIDSVTAQGNDKPLLQGEKRAIKILVKTKDGDELADVDMQLLSTQPTSVGVEGKSTLVGSAKNLKNKSIPVPINVQLNGDSVKTGGADFTFTITVIEAITKVSLNMKNIPIQEGGDVDLANLDVGLTFTGKDGGTYAAGSRTLLVDRADEFEIRDNHILQAKELPAMAKTQSFNVKFKSPDGFPGQPVEDAIATITVALRANNLTVDPTVQTLPVRGATPAFTAKLTDRDETLVPSYVVDWKFADQSSDDYAAIERLSNSTARVIWKDSSDDKESHRPSFVDLLVTAKATQPVGEPLTRRITVRMTAAVAAFAPLKVRLVPMHEQMAEDLFGRRTMDEFFVERVRLNNDLKNDPSSDNAGASILVFSDSIEVAVALQKRRVGTQKQWYDMTKRNDEADWVPVTKADIDRIADTGAATKLVPHKDLEPAAPVTCRGTVRWRPYALELVVNSSDPREARSTRAYVFRALNGFGTLASFITGFAVPGPSSDLPVALEKYSNMFIPGMEKLFPNLQETHRQNVLSETMKQIEEVPFGSDLSRVLFFPKKPIRGILRNEEVRISEICPFIFEVEVAILKKGAKSDTNAAVTTSATTPQP